MKFKTKLLEHQLKAVDKLSKLKVGALYMEMGTGKTRTAIELAYTRLERGKVDHIIWLCPCSVKNNLRYEFETHLGTKNPKDITVCGIQTLSTSTKYNQKLLKLTDDKRCFLIVDESNMIKNSKAKRTQNITRIAEKCTYKLILNGTPITKTAADLYAQWYLLDWRILGYQSYWAFAANHLELDDYGKVRRCLNIDYLTDKIAPYAFQVKKDECLDLPEKTYDIYYFNTTIKQELHYYEIRDRFLDNINEFDETTIYRTLTALQLVLAGKKLIFTDDANDTSDTNENKNGKHLKYTKENLFNNIKDNPRAKVLLDIVANIASKCIIFCKYTEEIEAVTEMLNNEGYNAVTFYGKNNLEERNNNIEKFKDDVQFLVANKACAGYGLNLQFASFIIFYSNDYDYGTRIQAEDRVHRIGQSKNVNIIDICAINKLDERILMSLRRKENLAQEIKNDLATKNNKKEAFINWISVQHKKRKGKVNVLDKTDLIDEASVKIGSDKVIRIGFNYEQKNEIILSYLDAHPEIKVVKCFYFKKFKYEYKIPDDIKVEYIEYADIEMYKVFYPLLDELAQNPNILLVMDEVMRTKNRSELIYNCAHHYLNSTEHRIVFEYLPVIDELKDIMILFDFCNPNKYKKRPFETQFLLDEDIEVVRFNFDFKLVQIGYSDEQLTKYNDEKDKLFNELGNTKDPNTVPRQLQLLAGNFKKTYLDDTKLYVARNARFKKKNVTVYDKTLPNTAYTILDFPIRHLYFNDFLKRTSANSLDKKINYVTTGLSIDNVLIEDYKNWIKVLEEFYEQANKAGICK